MSSQAAIPYIGSKISLVTNSELRYEGILVNINTTNSTVTLKDVRMSGTENRKTNHFVMPSAEVFDYIIFNGRDIKDLTVSEPSFSVKEDPAVVAVNVPPHQQPSHVGSGQMSFMGRYRHDEAMMGYGRPPMHMDAGIHPQDAYGPPRYGALGPRAGMPFMAPRGGPRADGTMYGYGGVPRGGFGGPRGGMRGGQGGTGSRQIVGELAAQPNSNLKIQVEQAFNFEEANQKFEKGAKNTVGDEHPEKEKIKAAYDKGASFFDSISCEALNRQQGRESRVDREKQRELDAETFGPAATLARGTRYYRRGYRRPMGGRGGRMGGPPGGYKPMMMGGYDQRMAPMAYGYGMGPAMRAK